MRYGRSLWLCAAMQMATLCAPGQQASVATGDAALTAVWNALRRGGWNDAEAALAPLLSATAEDAACQARFAEGNLWQFRMPGADPDKARAAYSWIVQRYPSNALAPRALLSIARVDDLDVLKPNPNAAIPVYRRVMDEYPESQAAQEAALHMAEARLAADGKSGAAQAVKELEQWMVARPSPQYAPLFELVLGKLCRYPLADYRAAATHLARALDLGLATTSQRASSCWQVATLAENDLQDRELAVKYYTKFLQMFPRHQTSFMAKEGLRRLGAPLPDIEDMSLEAVMKRGTPTR